MKNKLDFHGRTADEIACNELEERSSWHFFQAKSWLDYGKRHQSFSSVHYAAIELRYGIEYLLFELVVTGNPDLTENEYKACLGKPKEMNKLLRDSQRPYEKLAQFTHIILSLENAFTLKTYSWQLSELFKYWGIASEYLHFCGSHAHTYRSERWIISSINKLEDLTNHFLGKTTFALMPPQKMKPAVREIWSDFRDDKIDERSAKVRLQLIQFII